MTTEKNTKHNKTKEIEKELKLVNGTLFDLNFSTLSALETLLLSIKNKKEDEM